MIILKTDKTIIIKPTLNSENLEIEEIFYDNFSWNDLGIHENDRDTFYLENQYNGGLYVCNDYHYTYRDDTYFGVIKDNLAKGLVTTFSRLDSESEKEIIEGVEA